MTKYLAIALLMLALIDFVLTGGAHVRDVVKGFGHLIHYIAHMGDGSVFSQ